MKKLESRLAIVDRRIKQLERVALASSEDNSALLTQLRKLREDIKTTAKKDYINTQKEVLDSFRTLMEQLTTLSFFASEAEEDTRSIEKAISQLNKIKSTISEDLLGLKEEKKEDEGEENKEPIEKKEGDEEEGTKVHSSVENDVKEFIEQSNGTYFENYEVWFTAVKEKGLSISIDKNQVFAVDENDECFGTYNVLDMEGCLFNTAAEYDRAMEEEEDDDDEDDDDEDAIEEDDDD